MFTKKISVGPRVSAQGYKTVIDWDAVGDALLLIGIGVGVLSWLFE